MLNKQRKLTVYVINTALMVLAIVLQYSPYAFYKISTAVPVFAVGLTCAISAYFGAWQGAFWGGIAGVCMDSMSTGLVCFHTLTLIAVGLICGNLMSHLLNSNHRARFALCLIASASFHVTDWVVNYWMQGQEHLLFLFKYALPSIIYTAIIGFLFMLLYSAVYKKISHSEN